MVIGLLLMLPAGCARNTMRPAPPVSTQIGQEENWNAPLSGGVTAKAADDLTLSKWWVAFNDPVLTSLEERAVEGNLDLRQAEGRVRQAFAQRNVALTEKLPTVVVNGSASGSDSRADSGGASQSYSAAGVASWEPDFYGRIRGNIAAYQADLAATQEDLRNVLVSLTAELAVDYINLRSYQSQIAITKASLAAQKETWQLTVAKYQSGLATELDAVQARQSIESTRASVPTLEAGLQQAINAIALLLGEKPASVQAELAEVKRVPRIPAEVAVGVPADLLRRRPDIRSAERAVTAQTARVGVAAADLYPSFSLKGSLNLTSLSFLDLFRTNSLISNAVGSLENTIFNRGKIREQIKVQDAVLDQKVAAYEGAILTALKEVEDALVAFSQEQNRRKSLADATASAEQALMMSRELYSAGLKDFLNVLDSQRSLLTLQNTLAQCDANISADLVRLYKALGGGWDTTAGTAQPSRTGTQRDDRKTTQ